MSDTEVTRLQKRLAEAEQRAQWEKENPEALADAYKRGHQDGWSEGWKAALMWFGQMALHSADFHRKTAPEPIPVSLEKIAGFLEAQQRVLEMHS